MFRTLAGIDAAEPGYSRIVIRPTPPSPGSNAQHPPIDWVKASYDSIRGRIVSNWKIAGDRFHLDVTIPANTTAVIHLPAADAASVTESDRPLSDAEGVEVVGAENNRVRLQVGSGTYRFVGTGGIQPAPVALKTFQPADLSVNPENLDLTGTERVAHWDFRKPQDIQQWPSPHNLRFERRGDKVILAATGADPQLITRLPQTLAGKLAVVLRARPTKGASPQFFWASPEGGFNGQQQNQREVRPTDRLDNYLFRIGNGEPLQKLRFDPFSNEGEMEIESISIYQLKK
jgi:alpha-L-rhamnosidase